MVTEKTMGFCPMIDDPCQKDCMWLVDGECVMTKMGHSFRLIVKNTLGIKEELECWNDSSNGD